MPLDVTIAIDSSKYTHHVICVNSHQCYFTVISYLRNLTPSGLEVVKLVWENYTLIIPRMPASISHSLIHIDLQNIRPDRTKIRNDIKASGTFIGTTGSLPCREEKGKSTLHNLLSMPFSRLSAVYIDSRSVSKKIKSVRSESVLY